MAKVIDSTNLGYLLGKIKAAFWGKSETSQLTIDDTPTANSNNLVKSGGVKSYVDGAGPVITSQQDGTLLVTYNNGDTTTIDLNHNHPQYYSKVAETTQPQGGFLPDVIYNLGTLTGTVTFSLASTVSGNLNHYFWVFETSSTAPTVTWPSGLNWAAGNAPNVAANAHYEVSVLGGVAVYLEV